MFIQLAVPTMMDNSAMSSMRKNASWYEAIFDTYNLSAFSLCLTQRGFPYGEYLHYLLQQIFIAAFARFIAIRAPHQGCINFFIRG
jgi:hypothetical protein